MTPDLTSTESMGVDDCGTFDLNNVEHRIILAALKDEIRKSHLVRAKYYSEHESLMVKGYMAKTRLQETEVRTSEDQMFETLIKAVGRMKVYGVTIETLVKELKSSKKSFTTS